MDLRTPRQLIAQAGYRFRMWLDPTQAELRRSGVITIGHGTYGEPIVVYHEGDTATVRIGKYCSIAQAVCIMPGGNHRTDWVSTYPFRLRYGLEGALRDGHPASKGDVNIGNDVWIGNEALILSGVTIGDGAVVAARTVVTRDVPPYGIVAGNPGRVVAHRFSEDERKQLLDIRWWDWPEDVILERVDAINSPDVSTFVQRFGGQVGIASPE